MVENIYFIVLARDSDGDQLKKLFQEDFQTENKNVNLTVLNRDECIEMFGIENTSNEIDLVHSIMKSVPQNSIIFCDEALMKTDNTQTGKHYNWSNLRNERATENVFLGILSYIKAMACGSKKILNDFFFLKY